jgi:DNA helicase-2/ATP-dependent DNA helicase PcrA
LVEAGFPFVLREKGQLGLEHWVLQECHAFLRLLSNPNDMESFLRVGRRQLGLNAEGGEYLQRLAQDRQLTPYAAYRQLPIRYTDMSKLNQLQQHLVRARKLLPSEALNYYLDRMGFGSYLEWYAAQRGYPSDQFLSICDDLLADLRRFTSTAAYLKHVDNMLSAVKQQENAQQMPGINLMTLHSAKGLEFKAVWILGVTDGLLPHRLSKSAAQLEEERRLFYVGCTRAKDYLYLLAPNAYHDQTTDDSPFLVEAFGQALKARPQQPKQTQAQWSATKVSGNRTTTPEQIAPGLSRQPPPAIGQTIKHKDLGVGEVVSCVQEKTRGQTFHVLTIDFPHRADFKLHWELSLEMGFVERSD